MKYFIQFVTRFIPRTTLQVLASKFLYLIAPFYYGSKYEDPISGRKYRKLLPYGRIETRLNALSPDTFSLERHRLLWLYLKNETNFFSANLKVLHVAPAYCFRDRFKKIPNLEYLTSDLDSPWADIKMDICDIQFPENSFDVIMAHHVLEHVIDDALAMREFFRVMNPGGWGIFTVPINKKLPETYEDASITDPKEREKHFGQRDHLRYYGLDFADRLSTAGFKVSVVDYTSELPVEMVEKYCLPKGELMFVCKKLVNKTAEIPEREAALKE